MENRVKELLKAVRAHTDFTPRTALILGSGLGEFASKMDQIFSLPYASLPSFPISTVSGHAGKFVFGYLAGEPTVIMQGRVHYYEGYSMQDVVLPIRLMRSMGASRLILTNAAGGVNPNFHPGDLMLITDHISQFVPSPLVGPNDATLGERFPDMSEIYTKRLQAIFRESALAHEIALKEGVYLQTSGPNYETPAEIKLFALLGADAVGMSTACEAMAGRHMGMEIAAVSCITNLAAGLSQKPLSHEEVKIVADQSSIRFSNLLQSVFGELAIN